MPKTQRQRQWERTRARPRSPLRSGRTPPRRDPLDCALRCRRAGASRPNLTPLIVAIRGRRLAAAAAVADEPRMPSREEFRVPRYESVNPNEVHVAVRLCVAPDEVLPCGGAHSRVALFPTTREGLFVYPVRDLLPWQVRALDVFHCFRGRRPCTCVDDEEARVQRELERFLSACVRVPYAAEAVPNRVLEVHATLAAPIRLRVKRAP